MAPPPLIETVELTQEVPLFTADGSIKTTTTVISSWKCLLTPRSIFFRSEYRISLFFAATWRAALTSFLATPWKQTFKSYEQSSQWVNRGAKTNLAVAESIGIIKKLFFFQKLVAQWWFNLTEINVPFA